MYEFPESLNALRLYLESRHVDVTGFKSEREAAYFAAKIASIFIEFPKDRSQSMFPALQKLQSEILKNNKRVKRELKKQAKKALPIQAELSHRQRVAAAKAPGWVRAAGAAKFDPTAERAYRDSQLGQFGPASEVRRIDPKTYLDEKNQK